MKTLFQIQNELLVIEQISQTELINIVGGRRKKNKRNYALGEVTMSYDYSQAIVDFTGNEEVTDDKRRQRPGGGTTTTSPNNFV